MITDQKLGDNIMGNINTALAILNDVPTFDLTSDMSISYNKSINPLELLIDIAKGTVGYDWVIRTIGYILVAGIVPLEIAVKTILLTHIKNMFSCSLNPIISDELLKNGIAFDIDQIDLLDTLKFSPIDPKRGKYYYFDNKKTADTKYRGVKESVDFKTLSQLRDSKDLNCVLWYLKNVNARRVVWGMSQKAKESEIMGTYYRDNESFWNNKKTYKVTKKKAKKEDIEGVSPTEVKDDKTGQIIKEIQKDKNNDIVWEKFYGKCRKGAGIITFEYFPKSSHLTDAEGKTAHIQTPLANCIHVMLGNCASTSTDEIRYYNAIKTEEDRTQSVNEEINETNTSITEAEAQKNILQSQFESDKIKKEEYNEKIQDINKKVAELTQNRNNKIQELKDIQENIAQYQKDIYALKPKYRDVRQNYYYKHTLLEFNMDYLMSVRLFDPQVVAAQLIDALTGLFSIDLNMSFKQQLIKNEIKEMVNMIIETDDTEISDCFFTFSNDSYNAMIEKAEKNKANLFSDGNEFFDIPLNMDAILNSINNIDESALQAGDSTVIENALYEIAATVASVDTERTSKLNAGVEFNFIEELMSNLMNVIVYSIFSPKIYLLILINLEILGREQPYNLQTLIDQFRSFIVDAIRQIKDYLMQQLFDMLKPIITDLAKKMAIKMGLEQAGYYVEIIKKLVACIQLSRGQDLGFDIAKIGYADILPTETTSAPNAEC